MEPPAIFPDFSTMVRWPKENPMPKSLLSVVVLIIAVTFVSAIYTYFRSSVIAAPDQIASKGLPVVSRETAVFYAFVAILVGIIGFFVFRGMLHSAPDSAPRNFLYLAIGIGIVFEILGAVIFKTRALADLTLLHILHIAGYGWLLPRVFPG
jgi:hypothetical protein